MSRTELSLRRELEELGPLGDVGEALRQAGAPPSRRRRGARAAIVLAAAAAVVAVVGVTAWWSPEQAAHVADDPDAIRISDRISDWADSPEGEPAALGTALTRQCREACRNLLVAPDGATVPVREVSQGLAALLGEADHVSLSADARWIAIADDGAVRLFSLAPGESEPLVFEPAAPSYRWSLTWWAVNSRRAVLAEYDGDGTQVGRGTADLTRRVTRQVPVRGGERDADRVTTIDQEGDTYDLAGQMALAETLAGPDGTELTAPDAARPQVTVFRDGRRTGLIELGPDGPERLAYAEVEGWRLLGAIRPDQAALTTTRDGSSLVKGHSAAGIEWQHELPGKVTWYLPGLR